MSGRKMTGYPSVDRPWESGYSFLKKHPFIPNINIYAALKSINSKNYNATAIDCQNSSWTYGELFEDIKRASVGLKKLGVEYKNIVAICTPNIYEAVVVFLACNRIGAIATFLNSSASDDEIIRYLNLYQSKVLVEYGKTQEWTKTIIKNSSLVHVVAVDDKDMDYANDAMDVISYSTLLRMGEKKSVKGKEIHRKSDDALILYTSGSTGLPKSVVLTNENILAAMIYAQNTSGWGNLNVQKVLVCVPFAYPYGLVTSLLSALFSGATAILAPDIGSDTVNSYYQKKPEMIFGSPALLDLTMRNIPDGMDLSSVVSFISGGDFLTPNHASEGTLFFEKHNAIVTIGNGSGNAETVSCGTTPAGVKNRPETVGKVLVGSDAIVVDAETYHEKRYGEEGLLCISGKHVFREYYKEPELTAQSKIRIGTKEYFKTGTLGFIDDEGYFTLTGRSSRFYIMSSLNKVYLDHVQGVVSRFDCVKHAASIAVPDDEMLFVNRTFVVLEKGVEKTLETKNLIMNLCKRPVITLEGRVEQLKDFEIPKYIEFIDELPRRDGTEKIDYKALEEKCF